MVGAKSGTVILDKDGSFTYTPNSSVDTDTFFYEVGDDINELRDSTQVTINFTSIPAASRSAIPAATRSAIPAGSRSASQWSWQSVTTGNYQVLLENIPLLTGKQTARYEIYDGNKLIKTLVFNNNSSPTRVSMEGKTYFRLGTFKFNQTVRVKLSGVKMRRPSVPR